MALTGKRDIDAIDGRAVGAPHTTETLMSSEGTFSAIRHVAATSMVLTGAMVLTGEMALMGAMALRDKQDIDDVVDG